MKKQFLNRVQHIYLYKRLPENLVPWKVLKKNVKQTQRANQTKKAVGLPLLLKRGARGIHQKRLALKFVPSLKIDVLERGSLVSTPCSLKVWGSNVNRSSCSLDREKKGTTGKVSPCLSHEALTPSGAGTFLTSRREVRKVKRSAIHFDPTNHCLDARYQILTNDSKGISDRTVGGASLLACASRSEAKRKVQARSEAQATRGSANQPLGVQEFVSKKSKPLFSFLLFKEKYKWRKGASLYSCFQLEGGLSKQQEKRSSPFLLQLLERKKLRILYGNLSNREINAVIKQAKTNRGGLGDNIFRLLESRLDVVLCKIGFFTTISFARQWVYHGKVQVNSKVLTIANYNLQAGDVISISPSHCQFLKNEIDGLLGRHMVERAATPIIDHHKLSKTSINPSKMGQRWTPERQGATKHRRSLAIPSSKAWFGWEKNRSSPIGSNTGFKEYLFVQPWTARKSLPRIPLNLANIMGFSMVGPDVSRANDRGFDLRVARNGFPVVTWQKLVNDPPIDPSADPPSRSSLIINKVDNRLSLDQRKKLRFFSLKLTHVEVSFRLFTAVYLYSPQRILLPATIDIEKIRKSQTA